MNQPLPLPEKLEAFGKRIRLRHIAAVAVGVSCFTVLMAALPSAFESRSNAVFSQESLAAFQKDIESLSAADADTLAMANLQSAAGVFDIPAPLPYPYEQAIFPSAKPQEITSRRIVRPGDTLVGFLTKNGVSTAEAYRVVDAFREVHSPKAVKAGEKFAFDLARAEDGTSKLISLDYSPTITESIRIKRAGDEGFKAEKFKKELDYEDMALSFTIQNSMFGSAALAGVPDPVIMDLIRIYSWKVDFQRDVRSGDTIKVFYQAEMTEDGVPTNNFKIYFASMTLSGVDMPIYRFEDEGEVDFFTADGRSVRQGLLKTPLAFGRISSGYGHRKHPILGYTKMHKGVDFAAPTGTPIYAAADGTVDKKYYSSSYGNYVSIRHAGGIKTAYAHMKSFAKGMGQGKRVKQGDVIGYVGSTGRSTGPHLHYEVLKNGAHVNPKAVDLPTQNELKGKKLAAFKDYKTKVARDFESQLKKTGVMMAKQ